MATTYNQRDSVGIVIAGILLGVFIVLIFAFVTFSNTHQSMSGNFPGHMSGSQIDKMFIEQMIPHHESAISMAKLAERKASHTELQALARSIVASQTKEIEQMQRWYKTWYGTVVPTDARSDMMSGQYNTSSLSATNDFDRAFMENMIPHHRMAVMMTTMLERRTNRPEMKQLAIDIKTAQTAEITLMTDWQAAWGYSVSYSSTGMHMPMD